MLSNLNLNQLLIFESVYRTRNMTRAAEELHLTQSGVSQHIHALEEGLGLRLFDRVKKKLLPTSQADLLFKHCHLTIQSLEDVLKKVANMEAALAGVISVGMPMEFGNNILLPLMARFLRKHPATQLSIRTGLARDLEPLMLEGVIDFSFVDAFRLDPQIQTTPVYEEDIHLCIGSALVKKFGKPTLDSEYLKKINYIDYESSAQVLRMWFRYHLGTNFKPLFPLKAHGLTARGVARLIMQGLGAGVLPGHVLEEIQQKGHKIFVIPGKSPPLTNTISLAQVREKTLSSQAIALRQWLEFSLKNEKKPI